ncbi:MAG: VWA domain-containing protein [Acidobacteria bacterium]|nr:VWA domain-containing protein [Acidobacteriota bacterium]
MKKIALALVSLSLLGLSAFAQTGKKTRPRIVDTTQASKAPPELKDDTSAENKTRQPPILTNGSSTKAPSVYVPPPPPLVVNDEDDVIKIETNFVTLPVSVLDRNGRFVAGVQQREFQIFENGVEQKVEVFASVESPFTVVLLLDVSPSTQYKIDEIQTAAISFVNQLRPNDKVMVVSFDERYHVLTTPTNDRYRLENAIRQARFGSGTSLYDAVSNTISTQLQNVTGRKAVVLFTDGVDTTSRFSNYDSTLRLVEEVDALFYPIRYDTYNGYVGGGRNPRRTPRRPPRTGNILVDILGGIISNGNVQVGGATGAGTSAEEYRKGKAYLTELASFSGGRIFEADTILNLDTAFRSIAEELRRQYSIGYYPIESGEPGERKQIKVRVMRPDLVVRTKRSYIVGNKGT